jgi:hypothetical protein
MIDAKYVHPCINVPFKCILGRCVVGWVDALVKTLG